MHKWTLEKIHLPLKFDWKISRNSSEYKTNYVVRYCANESLVESPYGLGEVAFNVRYGESAEAIEESFSRFADQFTRARVGESLPEISEFLSELKLPNSLRFAIESAWAHFSSKVQRRPVWTTLGLAAPRRLTTSFSLPILKVEEIGSFIQQHDLQRFKVLKVKVDQFAVDRVREVAKFYSGPIRVDANEAWQTADEVLAFEDAISDLNIEFIEQPLPADLRTEARELKKRSHLLLVADEAITDGESIADLADSYHAVNIKLMKSGGYLKAIRQLEQARQLGMKTMLGCMVETSIGIASAMALSSGVDFFDLDGFLLLKTEPFGWVEEASGELTLSGLGRRELGND